MLSGSGSLGVQDTSVVIPEFKTQGMQSQVNVSALQSLGFMTVTGESKHVMLFISKTAISMPPSISCSIFYPYFILIKFQAEAQFLGRSLYCNKKARKIRDYMILQLSRYTSATTLSCSTDGFSWFPTDIFYLADSNFSMQKPNRSVMLQLRILKVFKCWYEALSTNLLQKQASSAFTNTNL